MNLIVEYKDQIGNISNRNYLLTRLAFMKHMAIAGQGYAPRPQKMLRTLGMFLHYSYYLNRQAFNHDHFSTPPPILSDPTEQGQFSNLAGKSIADFLSKRIGGSIYTVNFEAVASRPLKGKRPDLVAFSQNSVFTLEAKGRHQSNPGNMTKHKNQACSATNNFQRSYSIACISYNLYNRIMCKYYDPPNDNDFINNGILQSSTKKYYSGLAGFLNEKYFNYKETEILGEKFYIAELSYRKIETSFLKELPFRPYILFDLFEFYRPRLILPIRIFEYAKNGINTETKPFISSSYEDNYLYIDNDRVGLQIEK